MFSSFLLSLREAAEAALLIGLALGVLRRLRRLDCARVVWAAVGAGAVVSVVAALAFRAFGLGAAASAEPIFEGTTLLLAAALLTWTLSWMSGQSRRVGAQVEASVAAAACGGGGRALFLLTFVAVAREGIELAFFLTAVSLTTPPVQVLAGAALGLVAAAGFAWVLFATGIRLDIRRFFQLTGAALVLFAAGLVAKGLGEYNEAGWIPPLIDPVWDSGRVVSEGSWLGGVAHICFGYSSAPSLTVVLGYFGYLALLAGGVVMRRRHCRRLRPTLPVFQLGSENLPGPDR